MTHPGGMPKIPHTKSAALKHVELAASILRDNRLIELPVLAVDEDRQVLNKKARLFAEQLAKQLSEEFLVALDRALFELTVEDKKMRS